MTTLQQANDDSNGHPCPCRHVCVWVREWRRVCVLAVSSCQWFLTNWFDSRQATKGNRNAECGMRYELLGQAAGNLGACAKKRWKPPFAVATTTTGTATTITTPLVAMSMRERDGERAEAGPLIWPEEKAAKQKQKSSSSRQAKAAPKSCCPKERSVVNFFMLPVCIWMCYCYTLQAKRDMLHIKKYNPYFVGRYQASLSARLATKSYKVHWFTWCLL